MDDGEIVDTDLMERRRRMRRKTAEEHNSIYEYTTPSPESAPKSGRGQGRGRGRGRGGGRGGGRGAKKRFLD